IPTYTVSSSPVSVPTLDAHSSPPPSSPSAAPLESSIGLEQPAPQNYTVTLSPDHYATHRKCLWLDDPEYDVHKNFEYNRQAREAKVRPKLEELVRLVSVLDRFLLLSAHGSQCQWLYE